VLRSTLSCVVDSLERRKHAEPSLPIRGARLAKSEGPRATRRDGDEMKETDMPAGEKSGNPRVKHHRAERIAAGMRGQGVPRKQANTMAHAAMDREYASSKGKRRAAAVDMDAHDSRTGQRKTNLTTKRGVAVSGASKPSSAKRTTSGKRNVRATGTTAGTASGRKPRAANAALLGSAGAKRAGAGTRPPKPRTGQGAKRAGTSTPASTPRTTAGAKRSATSTPASMRRTPQGAKRAGTSSPAGQSAARSAKRAGNGIRAPKPRTARGAKQSGRATA
jgi:hypothetical protein